MLIRNARKSDIKAILGLIEGVVKHHNKIDCYYKPFSQYSGLEEEIGSWFSNKEMAVLIAEDSGKLVGYAQVSVEPAPTYVLAKKIGIVYDMFVSESYRRKKIAKKLFDEALRWFALKKVRHIELSVDARNESGIKLWKSLGFFEYKLRMRLDL